MNATDHQSLYNAGIIRAEISLYPHPLPEGGWTAQCSTHGAVTNRRFTTTYDDEAAARSALAYHLHHAHSDFARTRRLAPPLDVVFDGPPGPTAGRFIGVEDQDGNSVTAGEWVDRGDGTWALRLFGALLPATPAWVTDREGTNA